MRQPATAALAVAMLAATLGGASAEGAASERHAAWQSCLSDAFGLRAALSSPALAAEAALRECRAKEADYLASLTRSPLLDEEDVDRARPALVARARTWLLTGKPSRNL